MIHYQDPVIYPVVCDQYIIYLILYHCAVIPLRHVHFAKAKRPIAEPYGIPDGKNITSPKATQKVRRLF